MRGDVAAIDAAFELNRNVTMLDKLLDIHTAAVEVILVEGLEDGVEQAEALPLAIAAVAGLVGGVCGGQVIPGGIVAKLPEDAIQDTALVDGGTTAQRARWGEMGGDEGR